MIQVKNLSATYDKKSVFANLNFTLEDNSFTALCGKNGSGKSTLLSLMAGIIPAGLNYSGDILINGKSVFKMKRAEAAHNLSFLLQAENPVWNLTVRQFVETGLYSFGHLTKSQTDSAVNQALKQVGILDFAQNYIFNISGGEFQKCRLARALVQKTPFMLFDEPANQLDLPFQTEFLRELKKLNKTILFSIHDINTAAFFADDYLLLSNGSAILGKKEQIFTEAQLSKAFSSPAKIYTHPLQNVPQVLF
ncbi:MAG: ABC transporter ATP-binding protein [Treponema sp.]|nr:ABC transporter ATP-binding protein [Treponema sp.]